MTAVLHVEQADSIWTFALSRPEKMNALSSELVEALIEAVADAHARGARLLVFKGEGKNFSAGFDFGNLEGSSDGDLLLRFVRVESLLHIVATSPCATLALAHGRNFGAGVDLFGACRRRYCTSAATFRMPGLKFGIVLGTRLRKFGWPRGCNGSSGDGPHVRGRGSADHWLRSGGRDRRVAADCCRRCPRGTGSGRWQSRGALRCCERRVTGCRLGDACPVGRAARTKRSYSRVRASA